MSTSTPTTSAWKMFTMINFAVAAVMMAGGIWFMQASFTAKGFYAMAALMLVSSTVMLTKTVRDEAEADAQRQHRIEGQDAARTV
jgi:hypothetical protein